MSTLHVLLPPLTPVSDSAKFRAWLARGDRLSAVEDARDNVLRGLFRFAGDSVPVAALRHHAGADDAAIGAWLAADPVYVRSEATGARLMAWPITDLAADEAEWLATTLRPLFGDAGTPLVVDAPSAWCLHLPGGSPSAEFARPVDALGVGLLECLPHGDSGRSWRRLFSEAQIVLHSHPVNKARAAAGKLPVNALWFWGAGALPGSIDTEIKIVASSDSVLRGLAKLARIACAEPSPSTLDAIDELGHAGDALLDLDAPGHLGAVGGWLSYFQRWLRRRRFGAIELAFAGGESFRVRHSHRLRFWRRG